MEGDSFLERHYKIILGSLLAFVLISPALFTQIGTLIEFNDKSGVIGDTIGGVTAPFVNLFAAILVYLSFKQQIQANRMQLNANVLLNKETNYSLILSMIDNYAVNFNSFKELHDNDFRLIKTSLNYIISPSDTAHLLPNDRIRYYREDKIKCYKGFLKYIEDFQYIVIDELNIIDEIKGSKLSPNVKTTLFNQLRKSSYSIDKIVKFINLPYESDNLVDEEKDKIVDEKLKNYINKIKGMILLNNSILKEHIKPIL